MAKTTREYDYNIWGTEDHIYLTAYELQEDITGQADYLILNASRYTTIGWAAHDKANREIIKFLIGDVDDRFIFTDYDDWISIGELLVTDTPPEIKRWLDALPEYEVANG